MKRKNMNQREYSEAHVIQRAKERYDLDFTAEDYSVLLCMTRLANGMYEPLNTEESQLTHRLLYEGTFLYVVFDKERDLVTTLLPPEDFE